MVTVSTFLRNSIVILLRHGLKRKLQLPRSNRNTINNTKKLKVYFQIKLAKVVNMLKDLLFYAETYSQGSLFYNMNKLEEQVIRWARRDN